MKREDRTKLTVVFLVFCFLFTLVLSKAFYVQVINQKKLLAYSESQLIRKSKVYPNRGNILDRNGNPLAINVTTYNIFTIPKLIKDKPATINKLATYVDSVNAKKILKTIKKRNRFTWIKRKIRLEEDQVEKVAKLEGVFIEKESSRFYPNHELASQILGFVGVDNTGLSGVEYYFNEELQGEPKITKYLKDAKGRPIKFESYKAEGVVKDIQLTIDKDIQAHAEKYLKEAVEEHDAVKGGVGVIDANTGEIIAMANYPTFDPNDLRGSKLNQRKLSFISDPFEPGSVFKTFTVASGLENKIIRPDTSYFCEHGRFQVQNHIIKESDTRKKHEWLTVKDIIKYSSNIGTTKIAFDLTFPTLNETLQKFNVSEKTNIEISGESRGIYPNTENVTPLKLSNLAFGQGVATTGIQILAAYGAIANGGVYYPPTIIKGKKNEGVQILKEETSKLLTEMLTDVVDDGTGTQARIKYFQIAGKTGTAQKADNYGVYSAYIPNFIGYPVNVENKFVVFVYIDEPRNNTYYGNTVAAPVFRKLTEYILYKNREYQNVAIKSNDVENTDSVDYIKVKQSSTRNFGDGKVPNFIGLDKRSAERLADEVGIKIESVGIGVIKSQLPEAGTPYKKDVIVKLKHQPPSL